MNEALPPPVTTPPTPRDNTGLAVAAATVILLAALSAGGYVLYGEIKRMEAAKPQAPPEVTSALSSLRIQLDQQRSDHATQMQMLQSELATLKEQAASTPASIHETLAPVQEKLEAIAQQLQEVPVTETPEVEPLPEEEAIAGPSEPLPSMPVAGDNLRDYLVLRRAVESGGPYAAELAVLIPQLPDFYSPEITLLQHHAEFGLGGSTVKEEEPKKPLLPWMEAINRRLRGLVSIQPAPAENAEGAHETLDEVITALDRLEAGLMEGE